MSTLYSCWPCLMHKWMPLGSVQWMYTIQWLRVCISFSFIIVTWCNSLSPDWFEKSQHNILEKVVQTWYSVWTQARVYHVIFKPYENEWTTTEGRNTQTCKTVSSDVRYSEFVVKRLNNATIANAISPVWISKSLKRWKSAGL